MKKFISFIKETFLHWVNHRPARSGAVLSYYALFSMTPFILILVSGAGLFFSKDIVESNILSTAERTLGPETMDFIKSLLTEASKPDTGILATSFGVIILILGTLGIFSELNYSLNNIWQYVPKKVRKERKKGIKKILTLIEEKLLLFSLVPILGLLFIASIILSFFIQTLGQNIQTISNISINLLKILDPILSFFYITLLFSLVYKMIPNTKLPWREVALGAIITSLLFLLGETLLGIYFGNIKDLSTFGNASSLVAFMVWIFYSAQIFLLGASCIYVYSKKFGYLKNIQE